MRFGGPALLAVSLLVTSAGCSNNGKDQSSALCTARDHLVSSVQAVRDVDLASGGLDALRAALADVKTALDDVDQAAHEEFGDEVAAIRASFDQLSTTLASLPNQPSVGAGVTAVSTAAAGLTASIQTLADQLKSGCD